MYPNLLPLIFFSIAAAFTPGPNNIVGSYSGFNFGIKKSLPLILGVTFGYTTLITLSAAGLNVIFNTYPILKTMPDYEIINNEELRMVKVNLNGEEVRSESGALHYMKGQLEMVSSFQGVGKLLKSIATSEKVRTEQL